MELAMLVPTMHCVGFNNSALGLAIRDTVRLHDMILLGNNDLMRKFAKEWQNK